MNKIVLLDATFRDGGYITNWEFDFDLVQYAYIKSSQAGVDIVEVGYIRDTEHLENGKINNWDKCSEHQISLLKKAFNGANIALMIDQKNCSNVSLRPKRESSIDLIRIATHYEGIEDALEYCSVVKQKGYSVSLQLMGIATFSDKQLDLCITAVKNYKSSLDYLYIGDSYGSLFPQQVKKLFNRFVEIGDIKIGYHPHNNLQMAFANTLSAIEAGVSSIDGTLFGIGRGAGNLPLEIIVGYLQNTQNNTHYDVVPLLNCIETKFVDVIQNYTWGYNLPYLLSGIFNIHPNYATKFIDYKEFTIDKFVTLAKIINKKGESNFKPSLMEKIIQNGFCDPGANYLIEQIDSYKGRQPVYANIHSGQRFLIIGNGQSIKEQKEEIDRFIQKNKVILIGCNYLGNLYKPDYHLFSNTIRLEQYHKTVHPESRLIISEHITDRTLQGLSIKEHFKALYIDSTVNKFDIISNIITTNCRTVGLLAIGVASVMGAEQIYMVGLDGYNSQKQYQFYQEKMNTNDVKLLEKKSDENLNKLKEISDYLKKHKKSDIKILTHTLYSEFYSGFDILN